MYPVTRMTIAAGSVWLSGRLWRRLHGGSAVDAIDYRFTAFGALVPDVIDKPLALVGPQALSDGHTIGHTLLLSGAIIAAGAVLARTRDSRLLALGLGSLTHLLVDPVIAYPSMLLWPAFGAEFGEAKGIPAWYLRSLDVALVAIGAIALVRSTIVCDWARRFVRTGEVSPPEAASKTPHRGVSTV